MGRQTKGGRRHVPSAPSRPVGTSTGTAEHGPSSAEPGLPAAATAVDVRPGLSGAYLLHLQRAAGNRAVSAAIQRAAGPLDDTLPFAAVADTLPAADPGGPGAAPAGEVPQPVPTGATTATTLPPVPTGATTAAATLPPVPTGATTAAGTIAPGSGGASGAGPVGEGAGTGGGPAGGRPIALGKPTPPGQFAAVDQTAKRVPMRRDAKPVPDHVVDAAFQRDPSRVLRSPSDDWHAQMWSFQRGRGWGDDPPPAFQAGGVIAVAPGYSGPATQMPAHSGDDRTGLGTPEATVPTPLDTTPPRAERPMTRAIAPGARPGPERPGRPTAEPATHDEVVAAMAADPRTVVRSPNDAWHAQGYELDRGKGELPKAYKVEGVIIVAPDYPVAGGTPGAADTSPGVPTTASPGGAAGPATPAVGPASAGAPVPSEGPVTPAPGAATTAAAAASTAAPTRATPAGEVKSRRTRADVNVTNGAPGVGVDVLVGDETTEGDTTRKKDRGGTASVGGGNVVAVGGKHVTTETTGDTSNSIASTGTLAIKPDGSVDLMGKRAREKVVTDAAGHETKTGSSKFGGVNLGEKGVAVKAGASKTTAAGSSHTATGAARIDPSGNISGELGYEYKTKGGTSLTPSVSGGVTAEASDPVPAEGGGFDVSYTITTSRGMSLGAGKEVAGGPAVGVQIGSTHGSIETGTRHFDDAKQAAAFRDHAAAVVARERLYQLPPTTVAGALQIPIGEERGSGDVSGSNVGASVSLEGASLGYGKTSSTTHQFKVRRTGAKTVEVTGIVTGTKGSDLSGSGGITLTRGESETQGFEAVWAFDLGSPAGRSAFERYAKTGLPPVVGARMLSMTKRGSEEDHDDVSIPLLGTARWTGTTWEVVRTDAKGTHEQFGGARVHNQDPSWVGSHVFGQDELHSSAGITSSLESAKPGRKTESYRAEIKISGESGEYNREQLGKVFTGVPHSGEAESSGEWTLTAEVDPAVVRDLARVNDDMRKARTKEDQLRVYSDLVKEHGAAMVGAQVGLGGDATAWNVELKGDPNFPGESGRAELERKRAALKERLRRDPATARAVFDEARQTLAQLTARRKAVADKKRYTDLPGGLRAEQLKLIDKHIADFKFIRHEASREAVKRQPGEKIEDVRRRLSAGHGRSRGRWPWPGRGEADRGGCGPEPAARSDR